jgi:hypothetical protein
VRNFKSVLFSAILVSGLAGSFLYTGCGNKCGSTTCLNGSTCSNNTCSCPTGYSGKSCENSWSSKFTGTYTCTQTCTPSVGTGSWQSTITASTTDGGYNIDISNFANSKITYTAVVDSTGHLAIDKQSAGSLVGAGSINTSTNVITITYSASSGASGSCVVTMTRQ